MPPPKKMLLIFPSISTPSLFPSPQKSTMLGDVWPTGWPTKVMLTSCCQVFPLPNCTPNEAPQISCQHLPAHMRLGKAVKLRSEWCWIWALLRNLVSHLFVPRSGSVPASVSLQVLIVYLSQVHPSTYTAFLLSSFYHEKFHPVQSEVLNGPSKSCFPPRHIDTWTVLGKSSAKKTGRQNHQNLQRRSNPQMTSWSRMMELSLRQYHGSHGREIDATLKPEEPFWSPWGWQVFVWTPPSSTEWSSYCARSQIENTPPVTKLEVFFVEWRRNREILNLKKVAK